MKQNQLIKSSTIFGAFFTLQAIGYIQGFGKYGAVKLESAISFGVYHLAHIFQPYSPIGWPLSPFICGILLVMTPFLETNSDLDADRFAQH